MKPSKKQDVISRRALVDLICQLRLNLDEAIEVLEALGIDSLAYRGKEAVGDAQIALNKEWGIE